jgi:hypothetical protein
MLTPGAYKSIILPKFENGARESEIVEAPTVIAPGTRCGDVFSSGEFDPPAAT